MLIMEHIPLSPPLIPQLAGHLLALELAQQRSLELLELLRPTQQEWDLGHFLLSYSMKMAISYAQLAAKLA